MDHGSSGDDSRRWATTDVAGRCDTGLGPARRRTRLRASPPANRRNLVFDFGANLQGSRDIFREVVGAHRMRLTVVHPHDMTSHPRIYLVGVGFLLCIRCGIQHVSTLFWMMRVFFSSFFLAGVHDIVPNNCVPSQASCERPHGSIEESKIHPTLLWVIDPTTAAGHRRNVSSGPRSCRRVRQCSTRQEDKRRGVNGTLMMPTTHRGPLRRVGQRSVWSEFSTGPVALFVTGCRELRAHWHDWRQRPPPQIPSTLQVSRGTLPSAVTDARE